MTTPPEAVALREVRESDLPVLYEHQREPEALRAAAFVPREREPFFAHWRANVLGDARVVKRTIAVGGRVAGHVVCYPDGDLHLVGYWVGGGFQGRGVATRALTLFLGEVDRRPLTAYVARRNAASIRVLEKCGFERTSEGASPTRDGGERVAEYVYTLAR